MTIDWPALGTVFAVTLLATVGLVGVFTLGIVGLSHRPGRRARSGALARAAAVLCFTACAAAVAYGIRLILS